MPAKWASLFKIRRLSQKVNRKNNFKEIEEQIRQDRGSLQASLYREAYEADGHWNQEKVYSRFDAEDGAGFPQNRYANEAYRNLDAPTNDEREEQSQY